MIKDKLNVLIAEDDAWAIIGIKDQVKKNIIECNIYTVNNGQKAMATLRKESIDLLITDIEMQPVNGIELVREAKRQFPEIRIIVMSAQIKLEHIRHLAEFNVSIINRVNGSETFLENALLTELSGKRYISPNVTNHLNRVYELSKAQSIDVSSLEKQILNLLSTGILVKNIHLELKIGKRTVERMLSGLRKRFDEDTNHGLLNKAKDIGLI